MKVDYLIVGPGSREALSRGCLLTRGAKCWWSIAALTSAGTSMTTRTKAASAFIPTGPHYFRTNSERIWEFATRFGGVFPLRTFAQVSCRRRAGELADRRQLHPSEDR